MILGINGRIGSGKDTIAQMIIDNSNKKWEVKKFAGKLKQITALLIGCTVEDLEDREFKEKVLEGWDCYEYEYIYGDTSIKKGLSVKEPDEEYEFMSGKFAVLDYCEERALTPRLLMQLLGTECGREIIHPNIWCNSTFSDYIEGDVEQWKHVGKEIPYIEPIIPKSGSNWIITDLRFPNEAEAIKEKGGLLIKIIRLQQEPPTSEKLHESEVALDNWNDWDEIIYNDGTLEDLESQIKELVIKYKL